MATLAASAAAISKAGGNQASAALVTEWDEWIEEGEAFLSGIVKKDLVTGWAAASGAVTAPILTEYVSRYAANEGIKFDMSGYVSRIDAEDMININIFRMTEIEKLLKDSSVQDFMGV